MIFESNHFPHYPKSENTYKICSISVSYRRVVFTHIHHLKKDTTPRKFKPPVFFSARSVNNNSQVCNDETVPRTSRSVPIIRARTFDTKPQFLLICLGIFQIIFLLFPEHIINVTLQLFYSNISPFNNILNKCNHFTNRFVTNKNKNQFYIKRLIKTGLKQ